jgi:virginiamycin A acetyltransferase
LGANWIIRRAAFAIDGWRRRNRVRSTYVSPKCLDGRHISVGFGTSIDSFSRVGSFSYIGNYCQITKSTVGRYVSIGSRVSIGLGEHTWQRVSTSSAFYDNAWEVLTEGDCQIGSDSWIGVNVVVRRGTRVGVGAVVGASAVVTHDVPDYAIVAGVPARLLRYRFPEAARLRLKDSRWWEQDVEEARELLKALGKELGLAT